MPDKKSLTLLKKYYLPYRSVERPSETEIESAVKSGVLVPVSSVTHDEIVSEIKAVSKRITIENAAKGFLYSLSGGDMRYRSALSSLIWARALPEHKLITGGDQRVSVCAVCGCSHGFKGPEKVDWNEYGVFRYLPPKQYGREPDFTCAEYVLNDLREFEKLPAAEPCEEDYRILNGILACAGQMRPHNMDTALLTEIRRGGFINATGNAVHCILGILSVCGILEGAENKGFLHSYANFTDHGTARDGLTFYPLNFWRGRDGVNYKAVAEIFGSFSGDRLLPEKAVVTKKEENTLPEKKKPVSKAEQYFTDGVYTVMLTDEERRYLALDPPDKSWDTVSFYSVTYRLKKRTVLFYEDSTIVKVIFEEYSVNDDGSYSSRNYKEFDTRLETDNRTMLLPLTSRGRAKPVTPANVMSVLPFGCDLNIFLQKDKSRITVQNFRNNQMIPVVEEDRVKKIMTNEDFHEFMKYYISTCPDDYFESISAVRNTEHQTI